MTEPVGGGRLIAVPYRFDQGWLPKNSIIIEAVSSHPLWITAPRTPEELRAETAAWLVDPENHFWEIWDGGKFVGIFVVTRLTPQCDALFHFVLFGASVFAARRLIANFLGHLFQRFGLQRISVEVPDFKPKLVSFYRNRLGFLYEGEPACQSVPCVQYLQSADAGKYRDVDAPSRVPKLGSRRERAHWDGKEWRDVLLLRLLKAEHDQRMTPGAEPQATRETEGTVSHVDGLKAG